jgi:acyl-CoA thioesterase FadM
VDVESRPGASTPDSWDPGLTGGFERPVAGIDNGFVSGYRVRFDEAGPDGRIRTSTFLRYAQDVAWRHSEALGFDRVWYSQRGLWWVVRAVELQVREPVPMGEVLRVSTAVVGHHRIWARRRSDCRLGDGRVAATVVTDWVLLADRSRVVRIPSDFGLVFGSPDLPGGLMRVSEDRSVDPPGMLLDRFVRAQEIDPMAHVNNAAYLDWIEEALLADGRDREVFGAARGCRLEYLASATQDDPVAIELQGRPTGWSVVIRRGGSEPGVLVRGRSIDR